MLFSRRGGMSFGSPLHNFYVVFYSTRSHMESGRNGYFVYFFLFYFLFFEGFFYLCILVVV